MSWINFGWLLLGLGLGCSGWVTNHRRATAFTQQLRQSRQSEQTLHDRLKQLQLANQQLELTNQQLQLANQQLELAYQMATEMSQFKGGFLTRTSHELRSPLNGIIGMQQLILSDLCDSPQEERDFLAQSNQSALKMVALLDYLIDVAKVEHGSSQLEIQPVQLTSLLQTVYDLTRLSAKNRNLQLQLTAPESDLYVLADPKRLRQVLLNLVSRSIQQLEAGSITIAVQPEPTLGYIHIWIDRQMEDSWSDPIDLPRSPLPNDSSLPSPGMNLLVNQILIELMQGRLELLSTHPGTTESTALRDRLQCTIPLISSDGE
jgi:hypothetical protein